MGTRSLALHIKNVGGKGKYPRFDVAGATVSPDGRFLLTLGFDAALRSWDLSKSTAPAHTFRENRWDISWGGEVDISPDGKHFMVHFVGGLIAGDLDGLRVTSYLRMPTNFPATALFDARRPGLLFAAGMMDATAPRTGWWRVDDGRLEFALPVDHRVDAAALSPNGRRIVLAGGNTLSVWDVDARAPLGRWQSRLWSVETSGSTTRFEQALTWVGNDVVATVGNFPDEIQLRRATDGRQIGWIAAPSDYGWSPRFAKASGDKLLFQPYGHDDAEFWRIDTAGSPAGILVKPAGWFVLALSLALGPSLHRDARRRNSRILLVICVAGSLAIAIICAWLAMGGIEAVILRALRIEHAGVWMLSLIFIAAIGASAGGTGWRKIALSTLVLGVFVSMSLSAWVGISQLRTWQLLDRAFALAPWVGCTIWAVIALLTAVAWVKFAREPANRG